MKEINDDELQFVARHYEKNTLDSDRAWRSLRQRTGSQHRRTFSLFGPERSPFARRTAAAASILLIVGASVACGIWYVRQQTPTPDVPATTATAPTTPYRYITPKAESIVLKYDNAPIDDVLRELSTYYSRPLVLVDETAHDRCISGEIEATSLEEVVEILEATLDVKIELR